MIKAKTYNLIQGNVSISDNELSYATIFKVKRDGIGYETTDSNRGYLFDSSSGTITFSTAGGTGGERVRVIFKPGGGPEPPACEPVSATYDFPAGVEGQAYNYVIELSGSSPFDYTVNDAPDGMSVLLLGKFLRFTSSGLDAGTFDINVTVTNCNAGGLLTVTDSFTIIPTDDPDNQNAFIYNNSSGSIITSVGIQLGQSPFDFGIDAFPLYSFSPYAIGFHVAFTQRIRVNISNVSFPNTLILNINNIDIESKSIESDGSYLFLPVDILQSDIIKITLQ